VPPVAPQPQDVARGYPILPRQATHRGVALGKKVLHSKGTSASQSTATALAASSPLCHHEPVVSRSPPVLPVKRPGDHLDSPIPRKLRPTWSPSVLDGHPLLQSLLRNLDGGEGNDHRHKRDAARMDFLNLDDRSARPLMIYEDKADLMMANVACDGDPSHAPRLAIFPRLLDGCSYGGDKQPNKRPPAVRHVSVNVFAAVINVDTGKVRAFRSQRQLCHEGVRARECAFKLTYMKAKMPSKKQYDDCKGREMVLEPTDLNRSALYIQRLPLWTDGK